MTLLWVSVLRVTARGRNVTFSLSPIRASTRLAAVVLALGPSIVLRLRKNRWQKVWATSLLSRETSGQPPSLPSERPRSVRVAKASLFISILQKGPSLITPRLSLILVGAATMVKLILLPPMVRKVRGAERPETCRWTLGQLARKVCSPLVRQTPSVALAVSTSTVLRLSAVSVSSLLLVLRTRIVVDVTWEQSSLFLGARAMLWPEWTNSM